MLLSAANFAFDRAVNFQEPVLLKDEGDFFGNPLFSHRPPFPNRKLYSAGWSFRNRIRHYGDLPDFFTSRLRFSKTVRF